jgi:hypothetical protein
MNILSLLTRHRHYWGLPHQRSLDKRLVQTCYECGAEKLIKIELRALPVATDASIESQTRAILYLSD